MLDIALLVMRVIIGIFFIKHGYHKFEDPYTMAKWLGKLGYKPGIFWAWVLLVIEFFGGIALILGVGTKFFALFMSLIMLQGIYHRKYVKDLTFVDGWEINFVTLASTIALVLLGAGAYSLGNYFEVSFMLR
tara:strand:- start:1264 stop:1659 length:396 start_codon:yes stop_codon:yes gene_type:complete